jgi:hypothetical protein
MKDLIGRELNRQDPVAHLTRTSTTIRAKVGVVDSFVDVSDDFRYYEDTAVIVRWPDGTKSRPIMSKNLLILSEEGTDV